MNIIVASAEAAPYAKTGGLADITSSLAYQWSKYGQSPIIILPKYKTIDTNYYNFRPTYKVIYVPMAWWMEFAHLWEGTLPDSDIPVYLLENTDYYDRYGIYGEPTEYPDNDRRFIFYSRAIFEVAKALNFKPHIIHAHDFHAAFTMAFLKSHYRFDPLFSKTAGVYTIHNLAYQGWFDPERAMNLAGFGMKEFYPGCWFEHYGKVNAMKTGIMFADKITTVSPTYAKEIRNPYFSEGLQGVLNLRGADLIGILNGVDYNIWNPETDKYIFEKYSINELDKKIKNKQNLLKLIGLNNSDNPDLPLFGMVSRLTEQKGIDLLMAKLDDYLGSNLIRFVLLGSGESHYEDYFRGLGWRHSKNSVIHIGYNNALAHKIIASSDFILMPSRFEPCGLTQMYALKYGTIPIVRATGGLNDTVTEYIPHTGKGNGFVFLHYDVGDFDFAVNRALRIYNNEPHWNIIRKNAMSEDFSSSKTALEYLKVFKWALEKVL